MTQRAEQTAAATHRVVVRTPFEIEVPTHGTKRFRRGEEVLAIVDADGQVMVRARHVFAPYGHAHYLLTRQQLDNFEEADAREAEPETEEPEAAARRALFAPRGGRR